MPIIAFDDQITTDKHTSLSGSVLADNGNGADSGASLSVTDVNGVTASVGQQITLSSGALLTLNVDGTFSYDPNGAFDSLAAGTSAMDGFDYTLSGDSQFPSTLELSSLDGSNGFVLNGIDSGDRSGHSVSSAGDVNGDGIDDLIVGAPLASSNGNSFTGKSFVIFGNANGFAASLSLSSLDGTTGFAINGIDASDHSGWSVASAGDVNGDGIDDLVIGARLASPNSSLQAGQSYVVFGRDTGFGASLDLSSLDGTTGFVINGINALDWSGFSVASAGDINGDGVDDLIIGAPDADPDGNSFAGESYVVFGRDTGFGASLDLSSLDGTTGFVINGILATDRSGLSVSSAGDVNGDGIDDLIIGSYRADNSGNFESGESYVIFGRDTGFGASLDLSSLDGTTGFIINGNNASDWSGFSVSSAGDVNCDGFDDVIVGAPNASPGGKSTAGQSYVIFGRDTGFGASLDLSSLDGTTGFVINGIRELDRSGSSVSYAGDINGDGIDDLLIGAWSAAPQGKFFAGQSYVVFGRDTGFGASLDLSSLDGTTGFVINGIDAYDQSGRAVSWAGDVNGDGVDDLIIGANEAGPNTSSSSGESYVIFGRSVFGPAVDMATVTVTVTGVNDLLGGEGNEVLIGTDGADRLTGGPGTDILQGGDDGVYHTEISAQVYRLYFSVFGRAPEAAGHQFWVVQVTLGERTLREVAAAFVASFEFQTTYGSTDDSQFITLLYNNVLGRDPSTVDRDFWVGRIEGGTPREQIVLLFSESPEHQTKAAAAQDAFDDTHDITTWTDDVYRLYRAIFDRDPDLGGFEVWTESLASERWDFPQVVEKFMASPEFQFTYGTATSDAAFVTLLYQNVLGREPDPGGLAGWVIALQGGVSRVAVVTGFLASPEFVANSAAGLAAFMERQGKDDALVSDAGSDILVGGLYVDHFVFVADGEASTTTVTDLEPWDVLEFRDFGLSEAQVLAAMTQQGEDVLFAAGDEAVLLLNTQLDEITAAMIDIA